MAHHGVDVEGCATVIEGISNSFDFDQWIATHNLHSVKQLLCKHGMNDIDALSLSSTQYMQFMSDPELLQNKSNFIPNVLQAIKSICRPNDSMASIASIDSIDDAENVTLTQQEQDAMQQLKQNINELDKMKIDSNGLKINYSQSIQRIKSDKIKQIEARKQEINDTFNVLRDALNIRQQYLLKELDKINDTEDIKEIDIFQDTDKAIIQQRKQLNEELKIFNETIKLHKNRGKEEREELILMMTKQHNEEFNKFSQKIKKRQQEKKQLISQNHEFIVSITYNKNESKYNKLLNRINDLGAINKEDNDDTDDILINGLKDDIKRYKKSVDIKNHEITLLQQKYDQHQQLLVHSLKFDDSTPYRWYHEEKEGYIPVKIIDGNPLKFVQRPGIVKTHCDKLVSLKPENISDMTQIALCVEYMRENYELYANRLKWQKFDSWDINCKCNGIKLNRDIIKSGRGYQSVFGETICKSPYKYHWKLKQIVDNGQDFYIGVERKGKEIKNNYFCKSETGYGFSGYHGQLYAKNEWGEKYGTRCTQKGSVIDIYLDLKNNILSYGINGKDYGKAYDVIPGEYRLAVTVHMDAFGLSEARQLQLVSSTQSQ